MDRLDKIEGNVEIMLGRLNGLHEVVWHVIRQLPPDLAARIADEVERGHARSQADLIALPLAERTINEHQRMVSEGVQLLRAASGASRG